MNTYGHVARDLAIPTPEQTRAFREQSRHAEAEQVFMRAMGIYTKALGPEDCFVGTTHLNLALLYEDIERYAEADTHFRRALSITEGASGSNADNLLLVVLQDYAEFLRKTDRCSEAETFEVRAGNITSRREPLGLCPNCDKAIPADSKECPHCEAQFGERSAWKIGPMLNR